MTHENADEALLRRALAGSEADLRALVRRITPAVQGAVARTLLQVGRASHHWNLQEEVLDQTQEALLVLFEDDAAILRAWRPEAGLSLASFCAMVAKRRTISRLRSRRRNPWSEVPMEEGEDAAIPAAEPTAAQRLADADLLRRAHAEVRDSLNARGQEMLRLIIDEDRDNSELQAATSLSIDAIYQWRSRLTRALRDRVAALLGGER